MEYEKIKQLMKKEDKKEVPVSQNIVMQNIEENQVENRSLENSKPQGNIVKSPMVGTFYLRPSPESMPYVEVGKKVKKGDILCIIEAMKLMNEIESEFDGEIKEILVKDAEPVEYGKPLFVIG